jgi:hypothetical protein
MEEVGVHLGATNAKSRQPFLAGPPSYVWYEPWAGLAFMPVFSRTGTPQPSPKKQLQALAVFVQVAVGAKQVASKVDSARSQGSQDLDVGLQELAKKVVILTTPSLSTFGRSKTLSEAETTEVLAILRASLQTLVSLTPPSVFAEIILWLVDSSDLAVRRHLVKATLHC